MEGKPFSNDRLRRCNHRELAFTIVSQPQVLGALCIYPIGYDGLTSREQTVIHAFAEQAAAIIENQRRIRTLAFLL